MWLARSGRATVFAVTDEEALQAALLCTRKEGIIPALETAHALAALGKIAPGPDDVVVLAPESQVGHVEQLLAKSGHNGLAVEGSAVVWDGVAVQDKQRTFRISNTLSGRYARVEDGARKLCMVSLFGKDLSDAAQGDG